MNRSVIAIVVIAAAGAFWTLSGANAVWSASGFVTDLATEAIGIAFTVTVVDWLVERRRLAARGRQIAWNLFHTAEYVVWVWQGGPREMETEDLLGLLKGATASDPVAPCTGRLLSGLGVRCRRLLMSERQAVRVVPRFGDCLRELGRLASMANERRPVPTQEVLSILSIATERLTRMLNLSTGFVPTRLIRGRDASLDAQEARCASLAPPTV